MFGHDDNQQPAQDDSVLHSSMPDPVPNDAQGNGQPQDGTGDNNQGFGAPTGAPSMSETTASPAISSVGLNTQTATPLSGNGNDDLMNLKQQALQHLTPLVSHLDQTPEEKFRTTMMMIQASDDQSLIKTAFDAAQKINDDKARAQALLDIINEINYFTQHQGNQDKAL